jgi:ribosomal protein S25
MVRALLRDGQVVDTDDAETMERLRIVRDVQMVPPTAEDIAAALDERRSAKAAKAPAATLPALRDVFESLQDPTEYPFLVHRMLRLGYFALLAAYESTGKSYIGTQLALSVIAQRAVFGEFPVNEPMGACVFDMEMGEAEDRNRDRQMLADMGIEPEQVRGLYRRITLDDASLSLKNPDHVAYIGQQLDDAHEAMGRPILAILDSTDSLLSKRPWGDDADVLDAAISTLREGRRGWLVVLLLIHTKKKPQEGKGDYARDLEDVIGNATRQADMVMVLDRKGDLALRCGVYKRPGRSQGILQREPDGYAWTWTKDEGDTSTKVSATDALAILRAACAASASRRTTRYEMAARLSVTDTTADKYLRELESRGLIASTNEDTYKRRWEYWPVVQPVEASE